MKRLWMSGLGLSLGWFAAGDTVRAQTWGPGRVAEGRPAESRPIGVSLGRPVRPGTAAPETHDTRVTPAAFHAAGLAAPLRVIRAQEGADPAPKPTAVEQAPPPREVLAPAPMPPGPDNPWVGQPPVRLDALPYGAAAVGPGVVDGAVACPADCGGCAPGCRFYGGAEYLLWWIRDARFPPLVSTSATAASAGILGRPDTVVLFGGSAVDNEERHGGRFTFGFWTDPCQTCGVEGTYFFLGDRSIRFLASSAAFPVLARPFFNLNAGTEFSEVSTSPGLATGTVSVTSPTELWGFETNLRKQLCCGGDGCLRSYRVDLIGGFRYLELEEGLHVLESLQADPNASMFPGSHITVFDNFDTRNRFFGAQLGAEAEVRRGRLFLNMRGKVALGSTEQVVNIQGGQIVTSPAGVPSRFQGGLLALRSNSGRFSRDRFGVVPELGFNFGVHVTDRLRLFAGYTLLYWSDVVRSGDQIDRVLDVTQVPNFPVAAVPTGQGRPAVSFRDTDFWAHGVNFGLEFRY